MTQLGLGCVSLGSGAGRREADDVRLVHAAIDLGVTVFDTADAYGGGASEHVLGRAIKRRRDEVVIATKGGFVFRDRHPAEQWARRWSKPVVQRARRGAAVSTRTERAGDVCAAGLLAAAPPRRGAREPASARHRPNRRLPAPRPRHGAPGPARPALRPRGRGRRRALRRRRCPPWRTPTPGSASARRERRAGAVRGARSRGRLDDGPARPCAPPRGVGAGRARRRRSRPRRSRPGPLAEPPEVGARRRHCGGSPPRPGWTSTSWRSASCAPTDRRRLDTCSSAARLRTTCVETSSSLAAPPLADDVFGPRSTQPVARAGSRRTRGKQIEDDQVIVVGSGPCGAAAAMRLVERRRARRDARRRAARPPGSAGSRRGQDGLAAQGLGRVLRAPPRPGIRRGRRLGLEPVARRAVELLDAAVPRYAPEDFTDGARIDERFAWPVTYDELVPYYEHASSRRWA